MNAQPQPLPNQSLNIRTDKPVHTNKKEPLALYVSFPYSLDAVSKVKGLPTRHYEASSKEWEVPLADINKVIESFPNYRLMMKVPVHSDSKGEAAKPLPVIKQFENIIHVDFNWKTSPFDHQVEGFNYGHTHPKFLLGDEQGLGKTKQSIDIAVSRKGQFKHVLIVCCINSTKKNWLKEVGIHSDEQGYILGSYLDSRGQLKDGTMQDRLDDLNSDLEDYFLITNIETFREVPKKKEDALSKQEKIQKELLDRIEYMTRTGEIGMVIIDEIHKCKNPQSQSGKAIHRIQSHFKMALTGTPLMNNPMDLYNILKWVGEANESFSAFKDRYCILGGFGGYDVVGHKNMAELHARLNKIMLRRKKHDVLNLPPKIRSVEYVEMSPKQAQIYNEVRSYIETNLDEIALSPNPLANLIRLRQATGYTGILSEKIKESAKLDRLEELVEELVASGKKCIVFSNWEEMTLAAKERLARFNPAYFAGTSKADVEVEKEKFQNDPNCGVFIGTIGKLGTGHTLTAASTVFFLDSPWNMATKEQAEDRAHRIGTTGTVNIVTLVTQGTVDERIEEIVLEKADMAEALVDGKLNKLEKRNLLARLLDIA